MPKYPLFALLGLAFLAFACGDDGGPAAIPASPSPLGTPVAATNDAASFLEQFQEVELIGQDCDYDPQTTVADCGNLGTFVLDPPPRGPQIDCRILIAQGEAIAVNCKSQEPLQSIYYPIP